MRGLGHEITAGAVRIDSARLRTFRLNGSINSIGLVRIGHVHNGEIEVVNTCFLRVIAEFKLCPAAFGGDIGTGGHCCTDVLKSRALITGGIGKSVGIEHRSCGTHEQVVHNFRKFRRRNIEIVHQILTNKQCAARRHRSGH